MCCNCKPNCKKILVITNFHFNTNLKLTIQLCIFFIANSSFSIFLVKCADTANDATDIYFNGCENYTEDPDNCELYDDDDFVSSTVCCACGGTF